MSVKDMFNNVILVQSIPPAQYNTAQEGASADRKLSESLFAIINVGLWTDGVHTFTLEESDDDVTFTEVSASQQQGADVVVDAGTEDNTVYKLGYLGNKRYVRVNHTISGETTGMVFGAVLVKDHLRYAGSNQLAE